MIKRAFDIAAAAAGLIVFSPLLVIAALLVKMDSRGPILFKQERMGQRFRPFLIYKFRTMSDRVGAEGRLITAGEDPRVTRVGRVLRKTKVDELPQLINVLKGEMSLVGPRPEVLRYVRAFESEYEEILKVRPGITDLASLKYRNEEALLGACIDPEEEYLRRVLPDKIAMAKEYVRQASLLFDLALIVKTIFKVFDYRLSSLARSVK